MSWEYSREAPASDFIDDSIDFCAEGRPRTERVPEAHGIIMVGFNDMGARVLAQHWHAG